MVQIGRKLFNSKSRIWLKAFHWWKVYSGEKRKSGGTRCLDINRAAKYDECLSEAQRFFFFTKPDKLIWHTNRHGYAYLANYNMEKINDAEFTVESYKMDH